MLRSALDKLTYCVQIAYPFIYGMPPLNWLLRKLRPNQGVRVLFNGDKSQWGRALQMPHYSTASMPAISWHTGMHFGQVRYLEHCHALT